MKDQIWFGIVEVNPMKDNKSLHGAIGAFVNVAYKAASENAFRMAVKNSFHEKKFSVKEISDIERLDQLTITNPVNAEKLSLLKDLEGGYDFSWGNFHTFEE